MGARGGAWRLSREWLFPCQLGQYDTVITINSPDCEFYISLVNYIEKFAHSFQSGVVRVIAKQVGHSCWNECVFDLKSRFAYGKDNCVRTMAL